ncbi:MAG: hypothetical protein KatS3mg065_0626 [Chloroflexota bacterium]|nr:MAG: hypothetical protein KatS3mg065_0626 [Chloroflexota bacterium]
MPLVQPTRILILGAGGREHALAWRLAAEPGVNEVVVAPGSDGAAAEPRVRRAPVDPLDPEAVVALARQASAELVVVGPEAPLAAGVADALREAGIPVFGPTAAAARIETSKAFCHEVAASAGVRMARARAFGPGEQEAALRYAADLAAGPGVVVKADGLAGGKGVTVAANLAEAEAAIERLYAAAEGEGRAAEGSGAVPTGGAPASSGGTTAERPILVLEERLVGREASVIALTDGETAVALPAARDHKRLLAGDRGPNTGGMGAYSPVPDLPDAAVSRILETVHRPILAELARRGTPFCGALYAGLILTADGPALLECNARFGDPEAQVILPRLAGALGPLLLAAARGELGAVLPRIGAIEGRLPTLPTAAVGFVLAAPGYPEAPRTGDPIAGLPTEPAADVLVFHAGTRRDAEGVFRTAGGRVLTVVGRGPDLAGARRAALRVAEGIVWPGRQLRVDIAAEFDASAGAERRRPRDGAGSPEGADGAAPPPTALDRDAAHPRPRALHVGEARAVIPRYTLPEMGAIWTEQARFEQMLRVEIEVARAQARRGMVPPEAVAAIEARARVNPARIAEIERTTDHDVIAFVSQVAESVGPEGRYLHLGLTSSDVLDTALALQLRAAGDRLLADCDALLEALVARARAEASQPMMGRTHSVHAEPITLGVKLAGWAFEVDRDRRRLAAAFADAATGKLSGPVGTYSHLDPDLEAEVLGALGLAVDPVEHPDRPARPPRRRPGRHRHHRRVPRALRHRDPEPRPHRDRRARRALRPGPEGELGDAPQTEPDPLRADGRPRPAPPRLRPGRLREPAPLARAGHQPQLGRAGRPPRRDHRPRLHARHHDPPRRRPRRPPGADGREPRPEPRPPRRRPGPPRPRRAGLGAGGGVRRRPGGRPPSRRRAAPAPLAPRHRGPRSPAP